MTCTKGCCPTNRDHWLSVGIAPTATPTRSGGTRAQEIIDTEKRWDRDHAAYKTLVKQGIQPETLDGTADLAAKATSKREIEMGRTWSPMEKLGFEIVEGKDFDS